MFSYSGLLFVLVTLQTCLLAIFSFSIFLYYLSSSFWVLHFKQIFFYLFILFIILILFLSLPFFFPLSFFVCFLFFCFCFLFVFVFHFLLCLSLLCVPQFCWLHWLMDGFCPVFDRKVTIPCSNIKSEDFFFLWNFPISCFRIWLPLKIMLFSEEKLSLLCSLSLSLSLSFCVRAGACV